MSLMARTFGYIGLACAFVVSTVSIAAAETRALSIYHTHTGERATIVFKRDGVYDQTGLHELNHILRDWRRNETIKMDPALFDLLYEVYRDTGATGPIQVVCGYRSPATNNMLRSRSRGVAKFSQHMLGKATDFYLSGVPLAKLREVGMKKQIGGVGFYPTSGSPFVHLDTGNVRAWPRMTRDQLVRLFPDGKTMHLPADGGPLPRYQDAVAEYQRKHAGLTQVAGIGQPDTAASTAQPATRNPILAAFMPSKPAEDDEEDSAPASKATATNPPASAPAPAPAVVAAVAAPVSFPLPQPKPAVVASLPRPAAAQEFAVPDPRPMTVAALDPAPTAADVGVQPAPTAGRSAAILPNGWDTPLPPTARAPSRAPAALPADRQPANPGQATKSRPATVASLESHSMDAAFSALTGTPRESDSGALLGYAPERVAVSQDDRHAVTTVSRDRTSAIRSSTLASTDPSINPTLEPRPSRSTAAPISAKVAPKGDRADPMARLVSHVTEQLDPSLLDDDSKHSAGLANLRHPDLDTVGQMIVKPTQVLAVGFKSGAIAPSDGHFTGPAVVALALAQLD